jgi:hypothetical protein
MNATEIIGFAGPRAEQPTGGGPQISMEHFNLIQQLEQAKAAEIVRISAFAERLPEHYGPDVIVGFLVCELLGRRPEPGEYAAHVERLRRSPSCVSEIIGELLSFGEAAPPLPPA